MRYCIEILLNPGWFVWSSNFGKGFEYESARKERKRGEKMTRGIDVSFRIVHLNS